MSRRFWLAIATLLVATGTAQARTLCTIVADGSNGSILHEEGDCASRVTPASTFKIALAVMGFESGFLQDAHRPVLPFREGYPDWLGDVWRQPTDPARWMRYSVVWYSQQVAKTIGAAGLEHYAMAFGYGNADFSGDPGKDNGLERAWISSSLKISPREQVAFLGRLANGTLPVSADALRNTLAVAETHGEADGWAISGKTGSAYPRRADGSFDRAKAWGWYVGWAEKDGRRLIFARLTQDEKREKVSSGLRTRDALIAEWPALVAGFGD